MSKENKPKNIIEKIFVKHWEFYSSQAIETIKQQSGQIEQVSKDYQGRVLYELLQNAFDKAEDKIYIKIDKECLYIANNGTNFTISESYSYKDGNNNRKRSDFNALCSISTSNKNINDNFGNKGIGFNSVYSLHDYADIFFRIDNEKSFKGFRKYGEIKKLNKDFDSIENKDIINKQLESLQKEYKDRGIPGFYYPVLLNEDIDNEEFSSYKTVIRIKHNNKIQELINELKTIHFHFVRLKTKKDLTIVLKNTKEQSLDIEVKENYNLINKKINQNLLEDSKVKSPEVAILYKTDVQFSDYIYNYLPTKVISPFKMVDFNADFLTSLNRENINLKDGNDGKYNKVLLQSCIELHFLNVSSYLDDKIEFDLKLEQDNFWKYLQLNDSSIKKETIEIIKNIFNTKWENFADFIVKLAKKYFNADNLKIENFDDFWKVVFDYFDLLYRQKHQDKGSYLFALYWIRKEFNKTILIPLKKEKINCIPIINNNNEIISIKSFYDSVFFKKRKDTKHDQEENDIIIPDSINIALTSYAFIDKIDNLIDYNEFEINLKKFTNYDELLKHFRQISKNGQKENSKLYENLVEAEKIQKNILETIYKIYKSKNKKDYTSTHRYKRYIVKDKKIREDANVENNAAFAISTIFLKIKNDKYKPSQLCKKTELEEREKAFDFIENEEYDNFLKFLGVSLDDNYIFCEDEIYENFKDGIDFIPSIIQDDNAQLKAENIIKNIILVESQDKKTYPALINENYNFLDKIDKKIQKELILDLKIKEYDEFPKEYFPRLIDKIKENIINNEVIRLYNRIFIPYFNQSDDKDRKYLIIHQNKISFIDSFECNIASNKEEFELLKSTDMQLLCYYDGINKLKEKTSIDIEKYQVETITKIEVDDKKENDDLKKIFDSILPWILYEVSLLDNFESKINFIENTEKIEDIRKQYLELKFYTSNKIEEKLFADEKEVKIFESPIAYNLDTKEIISINNDNIDSSKLALIISKIFFKSNRTIAKVIENIYLKHQSESLQLNSEIENIQKAWDNDDYKKRYEEFLKDLFEGYVEKDNYLDYVKDNEYNWFRYTDDFKSEILDRLGELGQFNIRLKEKSKEYGFDLALQISITENENIIKKLLSIKDLKPNDEKKIKKFHYRIGNFKEEAKKIAKNYGMNLDSIKVTQSDEDIKKHREKTEMEDKKNIIKQCLSKFKSFKYDKFQADTSNVQNNSNAKNKKIHIKKLNDNIQEIDLKDIGDNGEYVVLGYYIDIFNNNVKNKEECIENIFKTLEKHIPESELITFQNFKKIVLEHLDNEEKLNNALIDFFYVALHYPYASFDMIACDNEGKPILIEVKTTRGNSRKNDSFRISKGEIEKAKTNENYIIARVTQDKIIFIKNPIKSIQEKLTSIEGDNFKIIPNGYTFQFTQGELA